MPIAELVLDARNAVGDSPVWSTREQALYWVDTLARKLHRWTLASHALSTWLAPEMMGCIAPTPGGGWIVGGETGLLLTQPVPDGQLGFKRLVTVNHVEPGMRFNAGRCDRQGRFVASTWLPNMPYSHYSGCIYSYHRSSNMAHADAGNVVKSLTGFKTPTGMAFSPDGRTLYVADSHSAVQMVWAFDYDIDTGTPSRQRVFVDMKHQYGCPDGAAVDADGCYWVCGNGAGKVHRFTPRGKLDRSLAVPVKKPAMCAFGGPQLDTLFVTSIRPYGVDLSDQPLAGALFVLRPGLCGLPEPAFSGRLSAI